jgi:hypothetical protein
MHILSVNDRPQEPAQVKRVRLKQRMRSPLFERLFRRISVLRVTSRQGVLYVSGALRRTYTLFYPRPSKTQVLHSMTGSWP